MIRLISKDEKLKIEVEGSIFYYRRITTVDAIEIKRKHTLKNELDSVAITQEILEENILGWDSVVGEDGNEIDFDKNLLMMLPDKVLTKLASAITGDILDVEDCEKK